MKKTFYEIVYNLVRKIPKGKVTTYGEIARKIGDKKYARAVGNALHNNPYFGDVPCHRVVNREGKLAENFAFKSLKSQKSMLEAEGVEICDNKVDLTKYLFKFD